MPSVSPPVAAGSKDRRLVDLSAAVAALGGLGAGAVGGDALGLHDPWAPFASQEPLQTPLLLVRLALLFLALLVIRRSSIVAVLGVLFLASLAVRAVVVPDILLTVVAIRLRQNDKANAIVLPRAVFPIVLAAGALPLLLALRHRPIAEPPPTDPPVLVEYWRGRRNLYHARAAALAWARTEASPSDGYLALARVDWELGEHEKARKVLEKVKTRSASGAARQKAAELERGWRE